MQTAGITADLGRQDFLLLMVTQLRNQDPLNPVKQEDTLAQLAQFSTLEGVEKLNANFEDMLKLQQLSQGADLVGRNVVYRQSDEAAQLSNGIVDAVIMENNQLMLSVNGDQVPLDLVDGFVAG
ncbi:MAG: flagellar hook capping FlgD N-terminal domain-containing protein [Pirellulales bacterium]